MYLLEPAETPYDLRFRLFGVSVRVHPMFWLLSALLGWNAYSEPEGSLAYLALWIVCVFVSVLIHELGHVVVGWYFGSKGHIVLYSFGGLAIGSSQLHKRWQRIAVSLAGPFAQFILLGVVWAVAQYYIEAAAAGAPPPRVVVEGLLMLWQINLYWPLLNLLPIFPLDGGQVTREVSEAISPERGLWFALGISMVVSGAFAVHFLLGPNSPVPFLQYKSPWMAIMFAMLCLGSFQALQAVTARQRRYSDDDLPWER